MKVFAVAYDNNNQTHGDYFEKSKDDIIAYIKEHHVDSPIHEIHSDDLSLEYINELIPNINASGFCFLAYSHGRIDGLIKEESYYISIGDNVHLFKNAFFYSMSCYTAEKFGKDLINNYKGTVFIGFKDKAKALTGVYSALSIDCDNYGFKMFLNGNKASEAYQMMRNKISESIDLLDSMEQPIWAGLLGMNLTYLEFYGNPNLTIEHIIN